MKKEVMLPNLDPQETKRERFAVYLTANQRKWLKKLSRNSGFNSQSKYMAALLDREINNFIINMEE